MHVSSILYRATHLCFPPPRAGEGGREATEGGTLRENETRSRTNAKRLRRQLTSAETILWSHLRRDMFLGLRFRRQHPIGPYIADFACTAAQLVVEIDGGTHSTPAEQNHDRRRDAYLRMHGWRIIRVTNTDVYKKLDSVMDYIAVNVEKVRKVPPPSRRMRGSQTPPSVRQSASASPDTVGRKSPLVISVRPPPVNGGGK